MKSSFWRGRRVFLTGHTGFKGAWCSLWLQELGAQVFGYSLPPPTTPNLFELARVREGMEGAIGDVRDGASLARALGRFAPEIVFHFAAQSLVHRSYEDPIGTLEVNALGTAALLEAVRGSDATKAVVVVTSDKCYANSNDGRGHLETDALGGNDPYSSSKACAELITASYRASFLKSRGVRIASVRAGNVIGGGDWAADRLVPDLIRAFRARQPVAIRNPGSTRPWQHVLDPLSGYLQLAERLLQSADAATAWNFGPEPEDRRSVSAMADEVCRLWGQGATWKHVEMERPAEAILLALDSTKARRELGWRPKLPFQQALAWTVEWYKAHASSGDVRALTLKQIQSYEGLPQ